MNSERLGLREFLSFGDADVAFVNGAERSIVGRPILAKKLGQVVAEFDHPLGGDHDLGREELGVGRRWCK